MNLSDDSLTIVKFRLGDKYDYKVFDKFDEKDETKRLDLAIAYSDSMADVMGDDYEQLWIKTCPIFPTR